MLVRVLTVFCVGGVLLGAWGAQGAQRIQVTNYGRKEPVLFSHSGHAERFPCDTCHHPQRSEGAHRCGACHRSEAEGEKPSLEKAAHGEGDPPGRCRPCHFGPKARKPLECADCHIGSE